MDTPTTIDKKFMQRHTKEKASAEVTYFLLLSQIDFLLNVTTPIVETPKHPYHLKAQRYRQCEQAAFMENA